MTPTQRTPWRTARTGPTAGNAMTSPGPQVGEDMAVDLALSVLLGARVGHLLVRDEDGRCVGLVTRDQLAAHRSGSWYSEHTRLRDIGHDRGPFTSSATPVRDAERAMRDRNLGASPVIDEDGYPLGILALSS